MGEAHLKYLLCSFVIFGLLVYSNQKHLFLDEEERWIVDIFPKDPPQIPTLYLAEFTESETAYLCNESMVVGIYLGGVAKAYPVMILDRHEVVNDIIGGQPVVVSFCPLTGSSLVLTRTQSTTFGVSGKLYKNNLVLYDSVTGSLWSQVGMRCIKGEMKGEELKLLSSHLISWGGWRQIFPDTQLMLPPDVFSMDEYLRDSYAEYRNSSRAGVFPLDNQNFVLENKEYVLGVQVMGVEKAYRLSNLSKIAVHMDVVGGAPIVVTYVNGSAQAFNAGAHKFKPYDGLLMASDDDGLWNMVTGQRLASAETLEPVRHLPVYWFAWYDFYPETLLYEP